MSLSNKTGESSKNNTCKKACLESILAAHAYGLHFLISCVWNKNDKLSIDMHKSSISTFSTWAMVCLVFFSWFHCNGYFDICSVLLNFFFAHLMHNSNLWLVMPYAFYKYELKSLIVFDSVASQLTEIRISEKKYKNNSSNKNKYGNLDVLSCIQREPSVYSIQTVGIFLIRHLSFVRYVQLHNAIFIIIPLFPLASFIRIQFHWFFAR